MCSGFLPRTDNDSNVPSDKGTKVKVTEFRNGSELDVINGNDPGHAWHNENLSMNTKETGWDTIFDSVTEECSPTLLVLRGGGGVKFQKKHYVTLQWLPKAITTKIEMALKKYN